MKTIDLCEEVSIFLSDKTDGNMRNLALANWANDETIKIRQGFLGRAGIAPEDTALVFVDYSRSDFTQYRLIESPGDYRLNNAEATTEASDGLAVRTRGIGLFLPLADCIGAVIFDRRQKLLMLVHAGRHNLEQDGLGAAVRFLTGQGTSPSDLSVWLSPSAGKKSYPVYSLGGKGLEEIAIEQLVCAGVTDIASAGIDTTADENYYSHSEGDRDKRFAVLAYMR
ncbi:MAG: laccase domain-containing protein [Clostridiales Family XIII bacterium]|jgi:hypothetical protein|nr:laccase domain-containing protein [Clostridiales Family XIII bacterium]